MPYADWRELERDRRLDRIDDLFTVDLVTSYVRWKLAGGGAVVTNGHTSAPRQSPAPADAFGRRGGEIIMNAQAPARRSLSSEQREGAPFGPIATLGRN